MGKPSSNLQDGGLMSDCLLWADLTSSDLEELYASDSPGVQALLAAKLGLNDYANNPLQGVLLEFHFNCLRFARENDFSEEKTSAFFSIMKANHEHMSDNKLTQTVSFEYFKRLLLTHSVQRPPYSVGIFNLKEVKLITDWVTNNYYRNFKQMRYTFTQLTLLQLNTKSTWVEVPPPSFMPLSDGVDAPMPLATTVSVEQEPQTGAEGGAAAAAAAEEAEDDEIAGIVDRKVELHMNKLREDLQARHDALQARVDELVEKEKATATKK